VPTREPLPTYQWIDSQSALRILSDRSHAIQTITASIFLTFFAPNGQSVRTDGAVAFSPLNKCVRLQTWKFNQKIFDLTLTPDGLWIEGPPDKNRRTEALRSGVSAAQIARILSLFGSDFFDSPDIRVSDTGGARFTVVRPLDHGQTMFAEVDRATLTVLEYRLTDPSGVVRFRLGLSRYVDLHGAVWPTKLIAVSSDGKIEIDLRDIELNGDIAANAFVPPPGAEKAS